MKKSTLGMFAAAFTGIALSVSGFAAGFETKNQYAEGTFTDVASSEWYAKEVKSAYELGFMNGVGTSLFSPDGKDPIMVRPSNTLKVNGIRCM